MVEWTDDESGNGVIVSDLYGHRDRFQLMHGNGERVCITTDAADNDSRHDTVNMLPEQ